MATLEEKLRGLAAKGELVHLSIAFKDGEFYANFAAASPAGGYSRGVNKDPVAALEEALAAAPVKPKRTTKPQATKEPDPISANQEPEPEPEITVAVTDEVIDTGFPSDWTSP